VTAPLALPPETLAAFGGDELRARVFLEKYALRDLDDQIVETVPGQMWARVAHELASVEPDPAIRAQTETDFGWLLEDFRFLPGGRILHGAGNPRKVTLLNCYFSAIRGDSLEEIYATAYRAAKTYSKGGGIGVDVSPLRPAGAAVHNAARHSTGAVSFMELYSLTTGLIGQSGRRGALMITIEDRHPDVLEFCRVKRNLTSVRFANISVKLSDAFMRAVEQDAPWTLRFDGPNTDRIERTIRARELWDELTVGAREWAEPGCLFWDRVVGYGTSNYGDMTPQGTNPCGEVPLEDGGACNLGSLALTRFVSEPFTPHARVDFDTLGRAVHIAVRFLDNVLTYNEGKHALPEQEEAARRGRRIGLGITGLGDLLIMLGLRYDSDIAIRAAGDLMQFIKEHAYRASVDLAKEKGPFPAFDADRHLGQVFFESFPDDLVANIRRHGLRNVCLLTIPPTGSISAMAGITNGLEPIFALSYVRRSESLSREFFTVLHPLVRAYLQHAGQEIDAAELARGRDPHAYLKERLPEAFVVSHEIDLIKRVDMQAALQAHIDQSISSTVNLPREATADTVAQVYFHAWRSGLKGISVYREGSREGVLLTPDEARRQHKLVALAETVRAAALAAAPDLALDGGAPEEQIEGAVRALADRLKGSPVQLQLTAPPEAEPLMRRPQALAGTTYRVPTATGTMFITINELDGQPVEVFCRLGKGGSHAEADSEMAGRLISVALRLQAPVPRTERLRLIQEQLEGIGGFGPNRVRSIADAIAKAVGWHLAAEGETTGSDAGGNSEPAPATTGAAVPAAERRAEPDAVPAPVPIAGGSNGNLCPQCHQYTLITNQGCTKCRECSYKEC
jgi:ribonucleoside-diphosphate reductase alpha chain